MNTLDIDPILTIVFVCLPLIFGFICLYYGFYYLKNVRTIQDTPTSKIRSAAQGYVELQGISKSLLPTPTLGLLSQRPCAWYHFTIEWLNAIENTEQTQSVWTLLERGTSNEYPFILEDNTGSCIILPLNAEIHSTARLIWMGHTRIPNPPTTSFLRWLFWERWGRYRYTEYRLELDMPIVARGNFVTISSEDPLVQTNPDLLAYCQQNNVTKLSVLMQGLAKEENLMVSGIAEPKLIQQFGAKSLIFFIAFVFFMTLTVHSTYPIVKKTLQQWPSHGWKR